MESGIMHLYLDAGQSGTQVRVRASDVGVSELQLPPVDTSRRVAHQLAQRIIDLVKAHEFQAELVAISATGISDLEEDAEVIRQAVHGVGIEKVVLAHDSVPGFLSAIGERNGVATTIGTGVVTLAVGPLGSARVDGWGNILGDAGSGYWIGRKGMQAALRAYDARGDHTVLLERFQELFPNVSNAYLELQAREDRVSFVAQFARTVIEESSTDTISRQIVSAACHEVALSIKAAAMRAGFSPTEKILVSANGSIARNRLLSEILASSIEELIPAAVVVEPRGTPLDGVETMVNLSEEFPLWPQVAVSTS